ncbi:MAG: OmpH family outer membrane protein [Bryobacteraceae bacterium]
MKLHRAIIFGLLAVMMAAAQSGRAPKVALVNIQDAILATTDGQNAAKALDAEFGPRKAALDQEQKAIAQKQSLLEQGKLSPEERKKLQQEIDDAIVVLNAKMDQADADLDRAQKKTLAELGKKMVAVIVEFATTTGYAMVFDTSTSQAPLLYADNATDITSEVIAAYESRYKSAAER